MKKIITLFILLFIYSILQSCSGIFIERERIGAICKDGTRTNATGSGACSGHGGVKEWIYKK